MTKLLLTTLLFCFGAFALSAQAPANNDAEFEKAYKRRIRQEALYGVYIPKDLTEAFMQLNKKIEPNLRKKFQAMPEDMATEKLFFSLGRWMTHNWQFYGGSRLSHYMKTQLGVHHPDDMSRFIIITYHRSLNKKPLQVKELLAQFEAEKLEKQKKRMQKGTILHEEKRTRQH